MPDPERIKAEREALELKKWREQTRKRYEERMVRKAKREGREADWYLKAGSAVPTAEGLLELKSMSKVWTSYFSPLASYFLLATSHLLLATSYFLLPTSFFLPLTS